MISVIIKPLLVTELYRMKISSEQFQEMVEEIFNTELKGVLPESLFFHTFEIEDKEIILFNDEAGFSADLCNRDDEKEIEKGPFAGKIFSFPQPEGY